MFSKVHTLPIRSHKESTIELDVFSSKYGDYSKQSRAKQEPIDD